MNENDTTSAPRAHFITMGCAKNEVDTRDMKSRLAESGVLATDEIEDSDVVIVNTCSFIQAAVEESIEAILDALDDEHVVKESVPVIVAGCMPARYGKELESELHEASTFLPCSKEDDIAEVVLSCLQERGRRTEDADASAISHEDAGASYADSSDDIASRASLNDSAMTACKRPAYAYVKISDGCDRFCSYCTIPMIRGRYHSFPVPQIEKSIHELEGQGVKEIVLIGQDTGIWGTDLDEKDGLAGLLKHLSETFPDLLFRVMYTQPEHIDDDLLKVMRDCDNIAPYLDIPLQHCSSSILEKMNRKGSFKEFLSLIAHARDIVPGIAIRTTLMVGFPGETEENFEELLSFVEEAQLEYVGIFAYSQEEGTAAAKLEDQVDESDKEMRLSELRGLADAVSDSVIAKRVGQHVLVVVEGEEEDGQLFGRSEIQAPEVDGVTFIDFGNTGDRVSAIVDDTLMYDMEASKQ